MGITISADDTAVITVSGGAANPGSNVSVDISIANNPGIMAMAFCIQYDSSVFDYVDYAHGYLTNYTITNHDEEGIVSFVSVEDYNLRTNGKILTLNFHVKATAEDGDYTFKIMNNNPNKYGNSLHNSFANASEQYVAVSAVDGVVTVDGDVIFKKGDVNGDGDINNKDLALLMQYVNDWDVEIYLAVADVNADGDINNKDLALLMQYVNDWDVELK